MCVLYWFAGAIALGHPLGCTGARQIATILPELERRNGKFGVISMCIGNVVTRTPPNRRLSQRALTVAYQMGRRELGTGMGAAAVVERE